jgi:hypothetical protein
MDGVDERAGASFLKTGDVVLFASHGLAHGLIRWFSRSTWTHVGLVLRAGEHAEPLLWEAVGAGPQRGTAMVRLAARIASFRGRISVRCLNRALPPAHGGRLEALRRELAERGTRRGLLDLIGAADDGWLGARPDMLGEPMDGELVALAYQRLGLLADPAHGGMPPSRYRPGQFAESHRLELENGYALGPELVLHDAEQAAPWSDASPQPA